MFRKCFILVSVLVQGHSESGANPKNTDTSFPPRQFQGDSELVPNLKHKFLQPKNLILVRKKQLQSVT